MIRSFAAITAALLLMLSTACPPPHGLVLYNNTAVDVAVIARGRRIEWSTGSVLRIGDGGDIDWEDLAWESDERRGVKAPLLEIRRGEDGYQYRLAIPGLPDEYFAWRSGVSERYLQLEKTWALYAVPAGDAFPVSPLPQQPPGLPLEPTELRSSRDDSRSL